MSKWYEKLENGLINDRDTGLLWHLGKRGDYYDAVAFVKSLGGNWLLPMLRDLDVIHRHDPSFVKLLPMGWIWSRDECDIPVSAWHFCFYSGGIAHSFKSRVLGILAVAKEV